MATITLPAGICLVGYTGPTVALNTNPSWLSSLDYINEANVNRLGLQSWKPTAAFPNVQQVVQNSFYLVKVKTGGLTTAVFSLTLAAAAPPVSNILPIVNAGNDVTITLPTSLVTLTGSATDQDGTIASYAWTQITGPNTAAMSSSNTAANTVSGLVAGVYQFRLTTTDNASGVKTDDVLVTVEALQTSNAPQINNLLPNSAAIGENIQVSGVRLTPTQSVTFSGADGTRITATVVGATSTSLTVTVPAGALTGPVKVTTSEGESNGVLFSATAVAGFVPVNLLFVGNSIVEGTAGSGGLPYPEKVRGMVPSSWTVTNRGHGGWGYTLMTQNATNASRAAAGGGSIGGVTSADVEPYYNPAAGVNILLFHEGSNEIAGYTEGLISYVAARKAEGWIVFMTPSANRTDLSPSWLDFTFAMNNLLKAEPFPGKYGDVFVNWERCPKISRYGDITNVNDGVHSANNPLWAYDKVHWTKLVYDAAAELIVDYLNKFLYNTPLPSDTIVATYPTTVKLPGQAATFTLSANAVQDGTSLRPIDVNQNQFTSSARMIEKLAPRPGFIGAVQMEQDGPSFGYMGFGRDLSALPGFSGIEYGFIGNDVTGSGGTWPAYTTTVADILRIELYADKIIWLRNGVTITTRNIAITDTYEWGVTFNGGNSPGIRNVRVEGNIVLPTAPPTGPALDQGEVAALTNFAGGLTVDGAGVATAPGAGQFSGSAQFAKRLSGGSGYRGFYQGKIVGQGDGMFFGSDVAAVANGTFAQYDYALFVVGSNLIKYENGSSVELSTFVANDVIRIEYYGPDAANTELPNGGAKFYKNSVPIGLASGTVPFPQIGSIGLSGNSSMSSFRIGGPGVTA